MPRCRLEFEEKSQIYKTVDNLLNFKKQNPVTLYPPPKKKDLSFVFLFPVPRTNNKWEQD